MLFCGPAAHVESNFTDDRQSGVGFDAIDLGEIDASDAVEIGPGVEGNTGAPPLAGAGSARGLGALVLELLEAGLDLAVTGGDLVLVELHEFDGLLERKQMLGAVVSFEGAGHSGLGALAAGVAQFG